jgi:hypothetical protein
MNEPNPEIESSPQVPPLERDEVEPPAPIPLAKPRRSFLARALRWLLVFLIVFGLGALLAVYLLYLPARQEARLLEAELQKANEQAAEQQQRIESQSGLETKNQDLEAEMAEASLHVNILKARTDVAGALLALAEDDPGRARVALSKTAETLDTIKALLDAGQQQVVDDMQARLELAAGELEDNAFAAESDLNVLATGLLELENSYFALP